MSREIKFRCWDGEYGDMIYTFAGSYNPEGNNSKPSITIVPDATDPENYTWIVFWDGASDKKSLQLVKGCKTMQFTGLKDKNGKEIYEGDIGEIRSQSGRIEKFIVEWGIHRREMKSGWTVDIPGFCFRIDGFPSFPIANNYLNSHDLDIIEIIGNIYENPELLQTKHPSHGDK